MIPDTFPKKLSATSARVIPSGRTVVKFVKVCVDKLGGYIKSWVNAIVLRVTRRHGVNVAWQRTLKYSMYLTHRWCSGLGLEHRRLFLYPY